ncbi:hypothetical protein KGQ20_19080 [Catenulispora sp. NF23]|uniref:hypothetical protein n=1 Tax=Catenulispora pinistramenti TaxID=2705254 RepID=UPI001BA675DB|nr:hypothetical protein [Catenulispora pinistramenti]MBS2534878.1 hypothetical protein [Catenulispora pinistramenti]
MEERKISKPDLVIAAIGLLALISMFLPWWRADYTTISGDDNETRWHETVNGWNESSVSGLDHMITGPLVWIPMMTLLALGISALGRVLAPSERLSDKGFHLVVAVLGILATVLLVVRWRSYYLPSGPTNGDTEIFAGPDDGTFLGVLCCFAVVVVSLLALTPIANLTPAQQPSED